MKQLDSLCKKIEAILKKTLFKRFRLSFRTIAFLLTISALLSVEWYFVYQAKGIDVLYKKTKCYFWKEYFFDKFRACSPFVIICRIIVGMPSESV